MTNQIKMYFVLPSYCEDELSTSDKMQEAFELCRQNHINPEWVSEINCLTTTFNKGDIVVFEKFEGETFQKIKARLSIVGPWCIITCLIEGLQVPNNNSHIYNMAMNKLTVTASNYTAEQKKNIKDKVEIMGGIFTLHVTSSVTHLITNSVRTQKYAVANAKGISVMLETWVEDVWNCSLKRSVKATDDEFMKHKCPCFKNLIMCSTGFEVEERNKIQKLITKNGGIYSGKLLTAKTDILVCKPGTKSEKYDVANRAKILCVRMEWILDSVEKGYAQPEEGYIVKVASSTPTKGDAPLNPDFSMMSIIVGNENNDPSKSSASDTINVSLYNMSTAQNGNLAQKENQEPDLVAEIDLQVARKAGAFLDGCGVLLAGFNPERRDKLCRVLRSAGATRYDAISDRVTQIIVGDPTSHEVRLLNGRVPLVSVAWILESIRRGQPAPEDSYIIQTGVQQVNIPAPSSPLSKKGLTLLQNDTSMITEMEPPRKNPESEQEDHESIKLYKSNKIQREEDTLAQLLAQENFNSNFDTKNDHEHKETSITEQEDGIIFHNKTFKLIDQTEEDLENLITMIEDLGGNIVQNNRAVTDYAVLPAIISGPIRHAATEVVNYMWIFECHACNEIIEPQYYHQPLIVTSNSPLKDCVITVSGYIGYERTFLIKVIQQLGAIYQDKFARVSVENGSILGSTHLVCQEAQGSKFKAAQRWKRPAVSHDWLLLCAEVGKRIPESQYLKTETEFDEESVPITPVNKENKIATPIVQSKISPTSANKRDHEGNKKSPVAEKVSPTTSKASMPTPTSVRKNSEENKDSPSSDNGKASNSPISFKRDHEGKKISPTIEKDTVSVNLANNENLDDLMITTEDGTVQALKEYMDGLRANGIFDTPSPLPKAPLGTPVQEILARLRREGRIPNSQHNTPVRNNLELGGASQGTPVGRYLRGLQERNVLPSSPKQAEGPVTDSPLPRSVFDVKTPTTPLGRFLGDDDPSRSTRKHWQRYLDRIPHYSLHDRPAAPPRRPSTPWSELKRQAWSGLLRNKDGNESEVEQSAAAGSENELIAAPNLVTESQQDVSNQLGQLQDMLRRRESSGKSLLTLDGNAGSTSTETVESISGAKDTQTDTVGWDEPLEDCVFSETSGQVTGPRIFMMSALDHKERANICNIIRSLGGEVSKINYFDSTATHVVCSNIARNEKILSSMAAGLWVLHMSYVEQSGAAGRFLPEEEYEIGNKKSENNIASFFEPSVVTKAVHWWRERVRQTGKGAFDGMRAIIFAKNVEAVIRLIEAGNGVIVKAKPPFTHNLDITHCFLDPKLKFDTTQFIPLAEQGIPCLNVIYLSNFLSNRTNVNIDEFIIPELSTYYR